MKHCKQSWDVVNVLFTEVCRRGSTQWADAVGGKPSTVPQYWDRALCGVELQG